MVRQSGLRVGVLGVIIQNGLQKTDRNLFARGHFDGFGKVDGERLIVGARDRNGSSQSGLRCN